jgi:hypothetical protein
VSFKKVSFAMSMWVEPVVACYYPGGNRKLSGFNELIENSSWKITDLLL